MAQIERVQQAGILLSHVDTHKHAHMFPVVLRPLLRAAKACGISAVRNPFEPACLCHCGPGRRDFKLGKRFVQMTVLRSFAPGFRREVSDRECAPPTEPWACW